MRKYKQVYDMDLISRFQSRKENKTHMLDKDMSPNGLFFFFLDFLKFFSQFYLERSKFFKISYIIFHSNQQWVRILVSPCPCQHLLLCVSILVILGVWSGISLWFDLHLPNNLWCWVFFHVLIGHLYIFTEKIFIQMHCSCLIGLSFH